MQWGGVVNMEDGSVEFKGSTITRAKAVRSLVVPAWGGCRGACCCVGCHGASWMLRLARSPSHPASFLSLLA